MIPAAALGMMLALAFFAALGFVLERYTRLHAPPTSASVSRAVWRLRLVPWDPEAHLTLAWDALRDEALEEATLRRDLAERAGASPVELLEFAVESAAARGQCAEARALFEEAIRARLAATDVLSQTLELGGYALQANLVARCGLREGEELADPGQPLDLRGLDLDALDALDRAHADELDPAIDPRTTDAERAPSELELE